jgi:hypothetical protein
MNKKKQIMMKYSVTLVAGAICLICHVPNTWSQTQEMDQQMKLVEVQKIWDKAPHNAFTDLIRFKGTWFCTFREGKNHWSKGASGDIRVIRSREGLTWESAAFISGEGDLRDPKLSVTPENKLMIIYFRRFNPHRYPDQDEQQFAQFSDNGTRWSEPVSVGFPNRWLWRVTWHEGKAYGVSYGGPEGKPPFAYPRSGHLLVSEDGRKFTPLADTEYGGESIIRFASDGTAFCLRRASENQAFWGKSIVPYKDWKWKKMNVRIGGPVFHILPDGRMIAAVRLYDGGTRTSLCWIDPEAGILTETLKLPSGGDTSYAGLVQHEGVLWISYYSSHEGKASIYLAKVRISERHPSKQSLGDSK